MRKLAIWLLAGVFLFVCSTVQAGSAVKRNVIDEVTLNTTTTSTTGAWNTGNLEKIAFFVDYNETDTGGDISVTITVHISHDGINYNSYSWYDIASSSTLVTSEVLSADANYVGWFEVNKYLPVVRITITATGADSDSTAVVEGYIAGLQ